LRYNNKFNNIVSISIYNYKLVKKIDKCKQFKLEV